MFHLARTRPAAPDRAVRRRPEIAQRFWKLGPGRSRAFLAQFHQFAGLHGGDRQRQRVGIGVADVFAGQDDQPPEKRTSSPPSSIRASQ